MNDLIVAGIDPGLATTGLVLLRFRRNSVPKLEHFQTVKTAAPKGIKGRAKITSDRDRTDLLTSSILDIFDTVQKPDAIALEDFVFMGNRGTAESQLIRLVENMRMVFTAGRYPTAIYDNAYWKTVLMQCRTANKEQVRHFVCRTLHLNAEEWAKRDRGGHMLDAAGLALTYAKLLKLKGADVPWEL